MGLLASSLPHSSHHSSHTSRRDLIMSGWLSGPENRKCSYSSPMLLLLADVSRTSRKLSSSGHPALNRMFINPSRLRDYMEEEGEGSKVEGGHEGASSRHTYEPTSSNQTKSQHGEVGAGTRSHPYLTKKLFAIAKHQEREKPRQAMSSRSGRRRPLTPRVAA